MVSQSGPASDGRPLVSEGILHPPRPPPTPAVSRAALNLTGTRVGCLFFFIISLKNTLFLARRVKTRACHPAYVCAHIKPEGLSGLSSYAHCEADVAALHTVCRPELCNAFASAAGPPGGDSRELRPSLSFLSAFLVVFYLRLCFLFVLPLRSRCS